nr:MAG TPA: hypothetical protein [Caudoviricetes sp.]
MFNNSFSYLYRRVSLQKHDAILVDNFQLNKYNEDNFQQTWRQFYIVLNK